MTKRYLVIVLLAFSAGANIVVTTQLEKTRAEYEKLTALYEASVDTNKSCDGALVSCIAWQARVRWILEERCGL